MKKRIIILSILSVILLIMIGIIIYFMWPVKYYNSEIPEDYIAVFHGGVGEITYSTYIYKIDNGHDNYGFKYINTTNSTTYWGSSEWNVKVTDKGEFDWTDGAFVVAKKNNAYSYVTIPNSTDAYTIEEFQGMFIMN